MTLGMDLAIATRSLLQHRRRSAFLGTALAAVTALLVLLQGLSTGIRETMLHTATTLSTGHLNVGGFFKVTAGQSAPVVTKAAEVDQVVRRALPELAFTVMRGRGWAKVISDTGSMQAGINGIDVAREPAFKQVLQIASGRLEDLTEPNTVLLFESQLKKLDVKVGDAITISAQTTRGVANTVDCRVVAIAKDVGLMSQWSVFIPQETLRALYQIRADATGAIHVHLHERDLGRLGEIGGRLRNSLEQAGYRVMEADPRAFWMKFETVNREDWTGQKLDVTTWEDELSFMTWTLQLLGGLTAVLLVILIAIVVTGIMNTMWIAIRERTREIGTLRAIGMQRRKVLWLFVLETGLLGLGGSALGAALASALAGALNAARITVPEGIQLFLMQEHLSFLLTPGAILQRILAVAALATVASIFPAVRAARLRPVTAMHHIG
jgi:ABC-type lipoprotein release transport system permease subunit